MSSSIPNKGTALVLEILPAFFGIYGIGWLYAGKVATGLILLLTGLVVIWGSLRGYLPPRCFDAGAGICVYLRGDPFTNIHRCLIRLVIEQRA